MNSGPNAPRDESPQESSFDDGVRPPPPPIPPHTLAYGQQSQRGLRVYSESHPEADLPESGLWTVNPNTIQKCSFLDALNSHSKA